jgi:hypothetical protein
VELVVVGPVRQRRIDTRSRTSTIRRRVAGAALALAGVAAAIGAGATTDPASAYQPDAELWSAIDGIRLGMPPDLRASHFAYYDDGPDGLPGPDGTPDGRGAFRFYWGSWDVGAAYVYRSEGQLRGGMVYGDILRSWAGSGYEAGPYGYPEGREHDASSNDVQRGCKAGDRSQSFHRDLSATRYRFSTACWSPTTGRTSWFPSDHVR